MTGFLAVAVLGLACFALIYGALSDMTDYRIPNAVSYGLVLLFFVTAPLLLSWGEIARGLIAFLVIFVASVVFWRLRWLGGGDVKFLSAATLWVGPTMVLPFLLLLCLYSAVLIALLRAARTWGVFITGGRAPVFARHMVEKAQAGVIPYGLPIAAAALTAIFWRVTH